MQALLIENWLQLVVLVIVAICGVMIAIESIRNALITGVIFLILVVAFQHFLDMGIIEVLTKGIHYLFIEITKYF